MGKVRVFKLMSVSRVRVMAIGTELGGHISRVVFLLAEDKEIPVSVVEEG